MYHMWQGNGWNSGPFSFGFPWGGIVMGVLLIGAILFAVFMVVRSSRTSSQHTAGDQNADPRERGLSILTERFARGEIDSVTFRTMRADLSTSD